MKRVHDNITTQNIRVIFLLIIAFILCTNLPLPWNESFENLSVDLLLNIRGERNIRDNFIIVYIGEDEIQAIGSWPITHDYYGYLIHILTQLNARAVGFDFLLETPDQLYPENDRILADFIEVNGTVCLPVVVTDLETRQIPFPNIPDKITYNYIIY